MALKKSACGRQPTLFSFVFYMFSFVFFELGSCYLCSNLSLSFLFCFCAKNNLYLKGSATCCFLSRFLRLTKNLITLSQSMITLWKKWTPSLGCYVIFISRPLFDLSYRSTSKNFIFTACSVLTDFCLYLHLPLNLFLFYSFRGEEP